MINGMTISLSAEMIYTLISVISSFKLKEEMSIPARIMLMGDIHADALLMALESTSGRGISKSPKIIPGIIAIRTGLRILLKENFSAPVKVL